jgi:hypothetical protein
LQFLGIIKTKMKINLKENGYPIVGGAIALLFCVLLTFRLGFFDGTSAVERQVVKKIDVQPAREAWLTISQAGRKIGYAHRNLQPTATGYRLSEKVLLHINTMGVAQALHFYTEGDLDHRMDLTSFNFGLDSSLFRFVARGSVQGNLLTLQAGAPGEEKKLQIVLQEPLHLAAGLYETSRLTDLKPGAKRVFQVFDPVTMGNRPVVVTRADIDETILHQGQKKRTRKFKLDFMGARQFAWLDEDGVVIREKGILGITLEKASRQEALAGIDRAGSADLTALASIPANKSIADPASLQELQVRLGNLGEGDFFLAGDRQSLQKDILIIRQESLPVVSGGGTTRPDQTALRASLQASPLIQSDHPLIVAKVKGIVSADDSDAQKAKKLVNWVYRNVKKRPVLSVPDALSTLKNMVGDCNEHAVLLAALARAAGIPAEVEAGLVYLRGRFYYHAWNALYLGDGWVTADAVFGQIPADVTHIRFVRGPAERQMDLLGLVGRLSLKIVNLSYHTSKYNADSGVTK